MPNSYHFMALVLNVYCRKKGGKINFKHRCEEPGIAEHFRVEQISLALQTVGNVDIVLECSV